MEEDKLKPDPRQRKVSLNGAPVALDEKEEESRKAELGIYDAEVGSPLVRLMFDFFTDPHSSKTAYFWGQLTAWLSIVRVLEIAFESCDGPNQYVGRTLDNSRYYFFLTDRQYWRCYIACMVPIIIDAVGKMIMLGFVTFASENNALYYKLKQDKLECFLLLADILGIIPFMVTAIYLRPYDVPDNQAQNVVMTLLELLITARILRLIKNMPPIRAIRIALLNSVDHLVLPIFFFFTFNITTGVFFYFVEPCYNTDVCAWQDLFESSFFSIVSMTTTGYGNQVPLYEFGRFVACCVMMFGALFLSMPLAIIGNEYESAWSNITEEIEKKRAAEEAAAVAATAALMQHERMLGEQGDQSRKLSGSGMAGAAALGASGGSGGDAANAHAASQVEVLAAAEEEKKRKEYEAEKALVVSDPVISTQKNIFESVYILKESIKTAEFISPGMLLQYCELMSALPAFTYALRNEVNYLTREKLRHLANIGSLVVAAEQEEQKTAGKRRLSVFGGGKKGSHSEPSAAVQRTKQLLAIEETGSDDETTPTGGTTKQNSVKLPARTARGSMNAAGVPSTAAAGGGGDGSENSQQQSPARGRGSMNAGGPPLPAGRGRGSMNAGGHPGANASTPVKAAEKQAINTPTSMFARGRSRVTPEAAQMSGSIVLKNDGTNPEIGSSNSFDSVTGSVKTADGAGSRKFSMVARQTMFRLSISQATSRKSMLNRLKKLVGSQAIEELRVRAGSADFDHQVKLLTQDPTSLKTRLWILLELPHSSKEAKTIQFILIFLISFSIFVLYTQTITNLTHYGESSVMCGKVLKVYCTDKHDNTKDPGCFVHLPDGSVTNQPLSYGCESDDCFKFGTNFGAPYSNVTCLNTDHPPFQDQFSLDYTYGKPYLFTSREHMHHINPICTRIECQDNSSEYTDVQFWWVLIEFIINITFTVELTTRLLVCESLYKFIYDYLNVFDVLSVVPFYVELFKTLLYTGFDTLNFSILASSPDPIFFVTMRSLKVFRMFKLTRHFNASKVISETAQRAYKQILGMISFLVFLVILFAILLYQVESGRACYVGDENCNPPPDALGLRVGDKIRINKNGELSSFGNVFYGLWFSFVTLTSTGYGDIVPVTNAGQVMSIILMLMGSFYLAMPLTAAASTFYTVHQIYNEKKSQSETEDKLRANGGAAKPATTATTSTTPAASTVPAALAPTLYGDYLDKRLQKRITLLLGELFLTQTGLQDFYYDMHKASTEGFESGDGSGVSGKNKGFVEVNSRKVPIAQTLRNTKITSTAGTTTAPKSGERKDSGGNGNGSGSGGAADGKKSDLLQQMQDLVVKVEGLLTNAEEDVLRIVVLHHKTRKNF